MPQSEKALKMAVVNWINSQPDAWCFKIRGGMGMTVGLPDISGFVKNRTLPVPLDLMIELKTKTGRLSKIQIFRKDQIEKKGGKVYVATSLKDVQVVVQALRDV